MIAMGFNPRKCAILKNKLYELCRVRMHIVYHGASSEEQQSDIQISEIRF